MSFHGTDLTAQDVERLVPLKQQVESVMRDGCARTIGALMRIITIRFGKRPAKEASVERMVRYMRQRGFDVEKTLIGDGLYEYQAIQKEPSEEEQLELAFESGT